MTGLIGLAIIGIWLVVLIPMWLNRHEADDASRSMDSFSTAMTVLSKRTANQGVTVDNYLPAGQTDSSPARRRPPSVPGAVGRARLMARRRQVAGALAGLLFVLALTALLNVTSWWYTLAAALATVGYIVHLRNEAIRDGELRRRRLARRTTQWEERSFDEPPHAAPRAAERFVSEDDVLPAPTVSATGTANGSRWEPVPVPLPTYVSKPVATRPPAPAPRADVDATGTIDLTNPGAWTEEHAAREEAVDHRYLLEPDDELDLILERRRAVGD